MDACEFYRAIAPYYDADYAARYQGRDIRFYVDLAVECGGPVLEMGCGTGRILLPTARAGIPIHGLDLSGEMLAELRKALSREPADVQQRVSLAEGDIRSAFAGCGFALVTAPFRVVQHLLTRQDQRAWLRNAARHLAPGGALCFDVFQPDFSLLAAPRGPETELERDDPATGLRLRRTMRTRPRAALQLQEVHIEWRLEASDGTPVSTSSASLLIRWYTRGELENLLELEGFEITDYWGSFEREPFGEGSQEQIIRAVLSSGGSQSPVGSRQSAVGNRWGS